MANNDILSQFSSADIREFRKDFVQMIKVGAEIDRCYGESQQNLDNIIPKFERLTEQFNKKYGGIKIKIRKAIDSFKVRLLLKAEGIKEFFAGSASRIPGLKSVGARNFSQVQVSNGEKFANFLDSLTDRIYLSYTDAESGTSAIAVIFDNKEKMVELLYEPNEVANENSAGFRLCAFYALKESYNKDIEIYGDASTFGFYNLLDETEKREWYDKLNPRFLE